MTNAVTQSNSVMIARRRREGGFTLIEAALTTVIVGTGVLAIVAAQQAYHQKNQWTKRSDTAMRLANELRERTFSMPLHDPITGDGNLGPEPNETGNFALYDDIDDFAGPVGDDKTGDGVTINPPMNALGEEMSDRDNWTQQVKVTNVDPQNVSSSIARPLDMSTDGTQIMRVTVTILFNGPQMDSATAVNELTWLVTE